MLGFGLDFQSTARRSKGGSIALITASGPTPNVSYSRASTAFAYGAGGDLVSFAVNTPRQEYDPASGAFLGTLIEAESTNLASYSIASQTNWIRNSGSGTDLSLNALSQFSGVAMISSGATYQRLNHPDMSLVSGTSYSISVWFRPGTSPNIRLALRTSGGSQTNWGGSISAPAAIGQGASGTISGHSQTTFADGTILLQVLFIANQSTTYSIGFGPYSSTSGEDVVVLGLQVEAAATPSSYIPTNGAIETRAADVLGVTGLTGVHDVTITYDDDSSDVLASETLFEGYWPALSRPHVKSMIAVPV